MQLPRIRIEEQRARAGARLTLQNAAMLDVIVAGAGPAGSIASIVLARAGVRVLIVDRDTFPRDKLCGDTLNPGAIGLLVSLGLTGGPLATARPLDGMLVSGPRSAVRAEYGQGRVGLAVTRRDLDAWLLDAAIAAGAHFEPGLVVRQPLVEESGGSLLVRGVVLARRGDPASTLRIPATMTVAADGRRSALARALGLASHPRQPRRWAFGTYASGIAGIGTHGEMHIRHGFYLGVAPIGGDVANVCVVRGPGGADRSPLDVIRRAVAADAALAIRFKGARFDAPVRVLGPLAVDVRAQGVNGLLLAGDAAGFVDPMTGDGLHLAMRSAVLAAREVLQAIDTGDFAGAVSRLDAARTGAMGSKLRFNRMLRRLVDSPLALEAAGIGARVLPFGVRRLVRYAGDAA